jgi:hypothetical protein
MKKILFLIMLSPLLSLSQNLLVDQFTFPINSKTLVAQLTTLGSPFAFTATTNSTTTLGGELDITSVLTGSFSAPIQMDVFENGYNSRTLEMDQGTGELGTITLKWDGINNSTLINYTGLASKSVSNCGLLSFNYYTDFGPSSQMTVKLTLYSNANSASEFTKVFNGTGGTTGINFATGLMPLSSLTQVAGFANPVNLSNVGAITMNFSFNTNGVDFLIDDVEFACPTSLPIKLTNFNVNATTDKNVITWATGSASNMHKFLIEKSIDGGNFTAIGEVDYNNSINNYVFNDKKYNTIVYYRIKMLEYGGTFKNSNIISVKPNQKNNDISITSNVIDNQIQVVINSKEQKEYFLQLVDINGKQLVKKRFVASKGVNVFYVNDLQQIPSGVLMLQVQSNINDRQVFKLLKN